LLIDALIASMSIPGYFIPKVIENNMYSDGGIINNFPLDVLKYKDIHTTLGFTFSEDHTNINTINNVVEFFSQIYACTYLNRKQQILTRYKENIIIIACGDYPLWNFHAPKEDRLELIAIGRKAVQDFYTLKQFSVKPVRRYSVS
jgi:NTE family protein